MTIFAQIDYGAVGTALAMLFIAFMQVWNSRKASRLDSRTASTSLAVEQVANQVAAVSKTVDIVHTLTNSQMGVQKKSLAEVTAAKFLISKNDADGKAAKQAMDDYLDHVANQSKVDSGEKTA